MPPRIDRALRLAWRTVLLAVVAASAVLILWTSGALSWPHRVFPLKNFRATEGFGHTQKFAPAWPGFMFPPNTGVLTEDGREMKLVGENGEVREKGMGAFRVGGERVLFSSSDGTDPKANGRAYTLCLETVVQPSLRPLILFGGFIAALLLTGKLLRPAAAWMQRALVATAVGTPSPSARFLAISLFVAALAIRLVFLFKNPEYTDEQMSIRGIPYSDAGCWHAMAKSTALGHGVDSTFPGMRALYPMFLANFYTWFGSSLGLAKALQALIGAATTAVIFLALRRAMPVLAALAAALFFAVDPRQITQAGKLMTEPFGLLLIVLSAWCLIGGGERRRPGLLFLAGAFFACANLARPLTLFAFPVFVALVALNAWLRESRRWRAACLHAIAFALGTLLCLAPWMIRERATHGIWAISSNSSSALFAASTPEFGTWVPGVEALPDQARVPYKVKARYDFFQERFRENLRKYPGFYASNVARSFGAAALGCANLSPALYGAGLAAIALTTLLAALRAGAAGAVAVALPALIAAFILACLNANWPSAFALLGAAFTLWWRFFPGAVLVVCHFGALLGSALFGNPDPQRARQLEDWLEAGWMFAGVLAAGAIVVALVARVPLPIALGWRGDAIREATDEPPPRWLRGLGWAFAVFLVVSIARLVVLNVFTTHPPRRDPRLTDEQRIIFLQETARRFPEWKGVTEPALLAASYSWARRGFVEFGAIDQEVFRFPAGVGFQHWTGLFEPRAYEHTSFVFRVSGRSFAGTIWMEVPGEIPLALRETPCLLIGLTKVRPVVSAYFDNSVETVAIIPAPNFQPDFTRAIVAPVVPEMKTLLETPAP